MIFKQNVWSTISAPALPPSVKQPSVLQLSKIMKFILDWPCKQHCEEADNLRSRMYQAFLSPLPCNDDLHSDFQTRDLFGRTWFEFLSAVYLRPRARTTHRICLHFSSMPFCVEKEKGAKSSTGVHYNLGLSPWTTVYHTMQRAVILWMLLSENKSIARMLPITYEYPTIVYRC